MNEKNFEYLKNLLDNLGFGTRLNMVLQQALEKDFNTFSLGISNSYVSDEGKVLGTQNKDIVKYQLNFNKSKSSDSVYLNDYRVFLFKPMEITPRSHTFDLERDHRITAWQAYRMLSGFSIEKNVFPQRKEGIDAQQDARKIWMKLSLDLLDAYERHPMRKFYPEYGYDLSASLDRYPLTNLSGAIKEVAIEHLAQGKLFKAEMRLYDQVFPVYIAANPKLRALQVFDKDLIRIPDQQIFMDKLEPQAQASASQREDIGAADRSVEPEQPWQQYSTDGSGQKVGR